MRSMVLHAARTFFSQKIEAQAILVQFDFLEQVVPQSRQLQVAYRALK